MIELRHLRYFVAVAEEGGFVRAAERLHISQPPLSTQIKSLEAQLRVRLLDRTSRGATPTPAGQALLVDARAILARVEHACANARQVAAGETGTLVVGFVSTADYHVLPQALRHFRAAYPGVQVELRELTTDAQLVELADERIDVGIALAPVDAADFVFERFLKERLILAAPLDHPLGRSTRPLRLAALAAEPFVMVPRPRGPGLHDLTIACCRAAGFTPRVAQHAQQMQTVISLVAGGFGFALVPESLRQLGRAGVAYRALSDSMSFVETGVVQRRRSANLAASNFVASLRLAAESWRQQSRRRGAVAG